MRASEIIHLLEPKVILFYRSTGEQSDREARFIVEGGIAMPLTRDWSARFDKGLQPNQKDHLHVMKSGRDISIINVDGTPSHGTTINDLPRKVRDAVRRLHLVYMEESLLIETARVNLAPQLAGLIDLFWTKAKRGF